MRIQRFCERVHGMMKIHSLTALLLVGALSLGTALAETQIVPPSTLTVEKGKVWFNRVGAQHGVVLKKDEPVNILPGDRALLLRDSRAYVNWADGKRTKLYSCDLFIAGAPSTDAGEKNSVVRIDAMYHHSVGYYVGDDDSGDRCLPFAWWSGPGAALLGAALQPEHSTRGPPISSP